MLWNPCDARVKAQSTGSQKPGTTASSLSLSTFLREKGETLPFPLSWAVPTTLFKSFSRGKIPLKSIKRILITVILNSTKLPKPITPLKKEKKNLQCVVVLNNTVFVWESRLLSLLRERQISLTLLSIQYLSEGEGLSRFFFDVI